MLHLPKGTKDVLPSESYRWRFLEEQAYACASLYNLSEIRTPVFEHTELFARGVGDTTDIVTKEMYTFDDKAGRSMTLKPEGTAGAARAFIQHGLFNTPLPVKMFYFTPVFRYENPQDGRLREHHQFGVELFGEGDAGIDAECIDIAVTYLSRIGISGLKLYINSVGCPECRKVYNGALTAFIASRIEKMCPTCRERLSKNPLRILDCKVSSCRSELKQAPLISDYLCGGCTSHQSRLLDVLSLSNIEYTLNPRLVRGLDYYTKTVFEIISPVEGIEWTICGGGRYDNLIKSLDGPDTPAVGFGLGLERLLLYLDKAGIAVPEAARPAVCVVYAEGCFEYAFKCVGLLRQAGFNTTVSYTQKSIKSQMKYAQKINARYTVIIGEREVNEACVTLKDMDNATESTVSRDDLARRLIEEIF